MMDASAELRAPWGCGELLFVALRSDRKTLRIVVTPEGLIRAHAPQHATDEQIIARVARRGGWIARQLQRFDQWRPRTPDRQYVSGETHLFLGRQYRLLVVPENGTDVCIDGDRLVLKAPDESSFIYRRALVRHWLSLQGHRHFPPRLTAMLPPFQRLGVKRPRLIIRPLVRRWGSFTPAGSLVLNSELVQASPHLIDYVLTHELAHALHPDHGAEWQELLTRTMPDWREHKRSLELQLL